MADVVDLLVEAGQFTDFVPHHLAVAHLHEPAEDAATQIPLDIGLEPRGGGSTGEVENADGELTGNRPADQDQE